MKSCRMLATGLMAAGLILGAEPAIELRGVVVADSTTKLSLVDKSNDTTRWVEMGQTFAGFNVKDYDPTTETATLAKDGKEMRLRLSISKIPETPAEIPEAVAEAIRNNLRQIATAAFQYFKEKGKSEVLLTELVGPDKYIKQLNPVAGEDYGRLELKWAEPSEPPEFLSVSTRSGQLVKIEYPGIDTSFVSKPRPPDTDYVSYGDTAAKIATRHNLTVQQLQSLNPEVQWSQLKVGQTLKVK